MKLNDLPILIASIKFKIKAYKHAKHSAKKKIKLQIIKLFYLCKLQLRKMRARSIWVRYIFTEERRFMQGVSDNLIVELEQSDRAKYINYLRLTPEDFYELLEDVGPKIEKMTWVRQPIAPKTRLQILLRYLASGNSMTSLSYEFSRNKHSKQYHLRNK